MIKIMKKMEKIMKNINKMENTNCNLEFVCRDVVIESIPACEDLKCACALEAFNNAEKNKQFEIKVYFNGKPYKSNFDTHKYIRDRYIDKESEALVNHSLWIYEHSFELINLLFFFVKLAISQCGNANKFIDTLCEEYKSDATMMADFILNYK